MNKIVFVVNNAAYFLSHRKPIGLALLARGNEVHIIAPGECPVELSEAGFNYHSVEMSRKGMNPLAELSTIFALHRLFKKIQPDLVHLVTIKPYLYGGIAARSANVPSVVSAVAGLGILFSAQGLKNKVIRAILYPMYRYAFGHNNQAAIFQNTNDRDLLVNWGVLQFKKSRMIRGAGADLSVYPYLPEPDGLPIISFAARLLKDKGVMEFVEASRLLKARGTKARFWLIGDPDPGNSNTVTQDQLDQWQAAGLVECLGYRTDIADLFSQSNIVSLPSYYGEGLPKVLIEAAACGRAVVTTDHPGCRDAIEPDTGVLVSIKDSVALADAIESLINNPDLRKSMGLAGRKLAEAEFSIETVVNRHLEIYAELTLKDDK
ncbi:MULTISPECIES: glycosyltransferase family 4 protein [Marinomonas]|uniref:Glycosyltransferase family 4 protein n=1 Tax=Marinomonas arctica TaxID=383750 RepID=A0A7H1J450_9GAMM|nr:MULTISPECIES: glycosyltransferase family 4 protein [Marinomonas]MCS7487754.1 glycosyl transferase family 1 [Marinomonas sp. BSi20414]QNT05266.1 glycosyltransferase family 4 protein [Marinomonas arctica]GGN38547.1 glycosyl transferase [Marinomonas arctica]